MSNLLGVASNNVNHEREEDVVPSSIPPSPAAAAATASSSSPPPSPRRTVEVNVAPTVLPVPTTTSSVEENSRMSVEGTVKSNVNTIDYDGDSEGEETKKILLLHDKSDTTMTTSTSTTTVGQEGGGKGQDKWSKFRKRISDVCKELEAQEKKEKHARLKNVHELSSDEDDRKMSPFESRKRIKLGHYVGGGKASHDHGDSKVEIIEILDDSSDEDSPFPNQERNNNGYERATTTQKSEKYSTDYASIPRENNRPTFFQSDQERADYEYALALQNETSFLPPRKNIEEETASYALALSLEEQEKDAMAAAKPSNQEQINMDTAWKLVEWVMENHQTLSDSSIGSKLIVPISVDDMVFTAKKFIECHDFFRNSGVCADICLGFHYTKQENLDKIREGGLLSHEERDGKYGGGLTYGDGIYVSNNPTNFSNFGVIGIMVAMLKGNCESINTPSSRSSATVDDDDDINTIIGNKMGCVSKNGDHVADEIVLRRSYQCLPLIKFESSLLFDANGSYSPTNPSPDGIKTLVAYYRKMQEGIDKFFGGNMYPSKQKNSSKLPWPTTANDNMTATSTFAPPTMNTKGRRSFTAPPTTVATTGTQPMLAALMMNSMPPLPPNVGGFGSSRIAKLRRAQKRGMMAPPIQQPSSIPSWPFAGTSSSSSQVGNTMGDPLINKRYSYQAPESFDHANNHQLFSNVMILDGISVEQCSICLEDMKSNERIVSLNVKDCNHTFHQECIEASLKTTPKCPICRKFTTTPQGTSPSGTLDISVTSSICSSFENTSTQTFVLSYSLQGGVQKPYHPSPGMRYSGTNRVAYIPDVPDGRKLLKRLAYAFTKGLNFTVGTSMTTGSQSVITWSSVHHKTSMHGGVRSHGFPDQGYFINCNEELDALGIPADPS